MNHQTNISNSNKSYLMSKGFIHVGLWKKEAKELDFSLDKKWARLPVLYVFLDSNDQVLYIGRTILDLENAMDRIKLGYEAQVTNHRIHNHLLDHLKKPHSIEILAYTSSKDLADIAVFFDEIKTDLIQHFSPIWNLQ